MIGLDTGYFFRLAEKTDQSIRRLDVPPVFVSSVNDGFESTARLPEKLEPDRLPDLLQRRVSYESHNRI